MIVSALAVGFFTAIGWWGGNKVTAAIDTATAAQVVQQVDVKKVEE
jgi:hypothetical protein